MRIAFIGQQEFGKAVLEAFIARGDTIAGVFCIPDKPGTKPDALKADAVALGLPVFTFASLRSPEAEEAMRSLDADLGVMAYVLQFAPQSFVNIPRHGTIQYHPSLLPLHRGPSSISWPVALGARQTGITIFRPTDGLDEGPVILQKACDIGPDETLGELYFNKLFPLGVAALLEKFTQGSAEAFAVAADVVAAQQGDGAGGCVAPRLQDRGHSAVNRMPRSLIDISAQLRMGLVQRMVLVGVVAGFGHGEREDARGRVAPDGNGRMQVRAPGQDAGNGADALVAEFAIRRHRLQRAFTLLRGQVLRQLAHIVADIAGNNMPAVVAALDEAVDVPGLVRAMESAEAEMQNAVCHWFHHVSRGQSGWRGPRRRRYACVADRVASRCGRPGAAWRARCCGQRAAGRFQGANRPAFRHRAIPPGPP